MQTNRTYISIGDFLDVYQKVHEKGISYLFKKFKFLPQSRVKSKWDDYTSTSDFWLIPEIQASWNFKISGDENLIYEDYVMQKYFKDSKNLKMLSVGCGEGYHERKFAKHNKFDVIDAVDLSPDSIAMASKIAKEENLKINFFQDDFTKTEFIKDNYDIILFASSLHHFKDVNNILKNHIKPLLKNGGILIVHEFCGPNRWQWSDSQLEKCNQLLKIIPKQYKQLFKRTAIKKKVYRPGILRILLVDPSEAIDSAAIIPSLNENFEVLEQTYLGWNILHLLLKGIAHNFINDEKETKELINYLINEEDNFVKQQNTTDSVFGVYKK